MGPREGTTVPSLKKETTMLEAVVIIVVAIGFLTFMYVRGAAFD